MMDNFKKTPGRDRVSILLTDGKATAPLKDMIKRLRKTDILSIVLGVGNGIDKKELKSIASGKGNSNVYSAVNFEELGSLAPSIVKRVCNGKPPQQSAPNPLSAAPL